MSTRQRPLDGLKVLDFTHVLAGPFATRVLGDLGADVIKINSAERATGANDVAHPYYLMWNRNKRALALNMADPDSRPLCRRLCEQADVVIDNFSVGVLDRWGVGYDTVREANEGVIYVQMSGMGEGGPWSGYVTYAPTIHALCGLTHLTSVEGREDIGLGFSYNDHQAGLHGAIAVLAALEARHRTGKGQRVDVSQFEIGANFAGPALLDLAANGRAARPTANKLPYDDVAPHNVYRCAPAEVTSTADERWIAIACMNDEQWRRLVGLMEAGAELDDERFVSAKGRVAHRDEIDRYISAWTATKEPYALMAQCQSAGVPAGVVQNGVDLAENDPQLQLADFLLQLDDVHPQMGQTFVDRLPLGFHKTPCNEYRRVREVGEDNADVLSDWLGMEEVDIQRLNDKGILQ